MTRVVVRDSAVQSVAQGSKPTWADAFLHHVTWWLNLLHAKPNLRAVGRRRADVSYYRQLNERAWLDV